MPGLSAVVARFANQTLVYWQKNGSDSYGRPVYAAPVEVKCRWEDTQKELLMPDGRKVITKAYLLLTQKVTQGSLVFLGTLSDWRALPSYPNPPTNLQGGREVIIANATPDIKNTSTVYEAHI